MKLSFVTAALLLLLPATTTAQASPFAQLYWGSLRGLREFTLYVNIDAPGLDADAIRTETADTAIAMLQAEGLKVTRGTRTGAVAIYPALFVELLATPVPGDSVLVSASITLIELTRSVRTRTYLPSMTWGVRNRPRMPNDRFHLAIAEALTGMFIHDWRCASGRLGACPGSRGPM